MNTWEERAIRAARNGEWLDLRAESQLSPTISGSLIRKALLGLPLDESNANSFANLPETGIRIRGATINGEIDLADGARVSGTLLPALALEECTISGTINLSHCRLSRLSLHGSHITHLRAPDCEIGGSVDLGLVSSAENADGTTGAADEGLCWLEMQDARIKGDIVASKAQLCTPVPREHVDERLGDRRFALMLRGAEILGSIFLQPEFRARGGVSLASATIQGDVWCSGAELIEHEAEAFNLQSAKVDGNVIFGGDRAPFRAMGTIQLYGVHIKGTLRFENVIIQKASTSTPHAIAASGMTIDHDLHVTGSVVGHVDLSSVRVGGSLHLGHDDELGHDNEFLSVNTELVASDSFAIVPLISLVDASVRRTLKVRSLAINSPRPLLRDIARQDKVESARIRDLSCYPGWHLVEVRCETHRGLATVSILWDGHRRALLLDGQAIRFYWLNSRKVLRLESPELAREYLQLFCSNLISSGGAFFLIDDTTNAGSRFKECLAEQPFALTVSTNDTAYRAQGMVVYKGELFKCQFEILRNGQVEMSQDQSLRLIRTTTVFDAPFRLDIGLESAEADAWRLPSPFAAGWQPVEKTLSLDILRTSLQSTMPTLRLRPKIDLSGLQVAALDDIGGTEWGRGFTLMLVGFRYDRLVQTRSELQELRSVTASLVSVAPAWSLVLGRCLEMSARILSSVLGLVAAPFLMVGRNILAAARRLALAATGRPQVPDDPTPWDRWLGANSPFRYRFGRFRHLQFDYARHAPKDLWRWRLNWFAQQYVSYVPDGVDFHPQPYNQLASVLQQAGQNEDARRILSHKLTIERKYRTRAIWRPILWLYWVCFDYGLSPLRALLTCAAFIVLGGIAVGYANRMGMMVVATTPAATVVLDGRAPSAATLVATDKTARSDIPCGASISALLYAADVFIPILDLREETRCEIRSFDRDRDLVTSDISGTAGSALSGWIFTNGLRSLKDPRVWRAGKAVYASLGWIVVSLTILTISGILRYQVEQG